MKKILIIGISLAIFVAGLLLLSSTPTDEDVIAMLEQAGSKMEEPHDIDFFLYFPEKDYAEKAAVDIVADYPNLNQDIYQVEGFSEWTLKLKGQMIPKTETMLGYRKYFENLASKYNGEYDGWGAEVKE